MRVLPLLVLLVAARASHADLCHGDPYTIDRSLPQGCPLHVWVGASRGPVSTQFLAQRGTQYVELTASTAVERTTRRVFRYSLDADCADGGWAYEPVDVDHYVVDLVDAQVGDRVSGELLLGAVYESTVSISPPGPCPPAITYGVPHCYPTEPERAACGTPPYRSPRCRDDESEYAEPASDRGIGARCPVQLVASATVVGGATFELYRPPETTGAYTLVDTIRVEVPTSAPEPRTEVRCDSSSAATVERLVYAAQFADMRPGDQVRIRDDEATLAAVWITGAETCPGPFRSSWCWVEPTCPMEPSKSDEPGGCAATNGSGPLVAVLFAIALRRRLKGCKRSVRSISCSRSPHRAS